MHHRSSGLLAGLALLVSGALGSAAAQSNVIPGTDVRLGGLSTLKSWTHQGSYPNGMIALSMTTTACNVGTVQVPWLKAMNPDHPVIAFLVARESGGRLVQISDQSYVKHGFFALSNSQCTPCQGGSGNGTFLGIGCSDTYSVNNNGDNYWLGPPEEIDPWLGDWNPVCSHFDRGEPAVAPPADCDGVRSLTTAQATALGPVGHRVQVQDADLDVPGATFYYAAQYVVRGEPRDNRGNNLGSRRLLTNWNGSNWDLGSSGALLDGSVLQQWSGASVSTAANGFDDGHVHLAVKPTQTGSLFHYEYAVHNQDNFRGVGAVRIPLRPGAVATNAGFRDIDGNAGNDWSIAQVGDELIFSTGGNPVAWNTIYNFWFDCDAAPVAGQVELDQFLAGPGLPTLAHPTLTPEGGACPPAATYCTAKVNSNLCLPQIASSGQASATAGSGFVISVSDVIPATNGLYFYSKTGPAAQPFQDGFLCAQAPVLRTPGQGSGGAAACSGSFSLDFNAYIAGGADPGLVSGQQVWGQFWYRDPAVASTTGLSNAITYVICP